MKLWEKVNNITGNSSKARFLVEYINAGSKFIMSSLPEKWLWTIATETEIYGRQSVNDTDTNVIGNGSEVAFDKILAVYRFDGTKRRIAREISDKFIHSTDENNSLSFVINFVINKTSGHFAFSSPEKNSKNNKEKNTKRHRHSAPVYC